MTRSDGGLKVNVGDDGGGEGACLETWPGDMIDASLKEEIERSMTPTSRVTDSMLQFKMGVRVKY